MGGTITGNHTGMHWRPMIPERQNSSTQKMGSASQNCSPKQQLNAERKPKLKPKIP
jgi:hypothetical protein